MGKFGWNLPPGAANDPNAPYNEPDRSHEHRWPSQEEDLEPLIEENAAIFSEECTFAEGRRGNGWQCEETRKYRFELAWFQSKKTGIIYLESETDRFELLAEVALMAVEMDGEVTAMDPDEDLGYVTVETDEWKVKFKADTQPQIDPPPR